MSDAGATYAHDMRRAVREKAADAGLESIGAVFIGSLVQLYLTAVTNGQGIHYLGSTLDSDKLKIVVRPLFRPSIPFAPS